MALINCPECGKMVSSRAKSCPNCGCPIDDDVKLENKNEEDDSILVRCLSDDKKLKETTFEYADSYGEIARCKIGATTRIHLYKSPVKITVWQHILGLPGASTTFTAKAGKCYEVKYHKQGLLMWGTSVSEVSHID